MTIIASIFISSTKFSFIILYALICVFKFYFLMNLKYSKNCLSHYFLNLPSCLLIWCCSSNLVCFLDGSHNSWPHTCFLIKCCHFYSIFSNPHAFFFPANSLHFCPMICHVFFLKFFILVFAVISSLNRNIS